MSNGGEDEEQGNVKKIQTNYALYPIKSHRLVKKARL